MAIERRKQHLDDPITAQIDPNLVGIVFGRVINNTRRSVVVNGQARPFQRIALQTAPTDATDPDPIIDHQHTRPDTAI